MRSALLAKKGCGSDAGAAGDGCLTPAKVLSGKSGTVLAPARSSQISVFDEEVM